jgi:hypothetical protein
VVSHVVISYWLRISKYITSADKILSANINKVPSFTSLARFSPFLPRKVLVTESARFESDLQTESEKALATGGEAEIYERDLEQVYTTADTSPLSH